MRKGFAILLAAMFLLAIPAVAQEEGPGLEGITADPGSFWGQTITFEGVLVEYINPYSFVLGEGAAIDDDRVLVINDTLAPLPATLVRGERIRVTGIVLPGIDARDNDPNAIPFVDAVLNDVGRMGGSMTDPEVETTTDTSAQTNVGASGGTGDTTTTTIVGTPMPETPLAPTPEMEMTAEATADMGMDMTTTPMMEATMEMTVAPGMDATAETTPMMDATMAPEMTGVPEMTMEATMDTSNMGDMTDNILPSLWEDGLAFYWNGNLPDDFNGFTIVRLINITDVEWVPIETTP